MSKINVLSSKVFNRISAGEVVERPSSVVKELVENSLDAGAKNIEIYILSGGIAMIKITDDGSGIEKSELNKAMLPHATSKILKVSDLDNITSLGFRGEALASIASVSKLRIVSRPKEQIEGASIYSEGGKMEEVTDYPSSFGTEITVSNLFYNTPVREKFLKTPRSEESEVSVTVARFILGHPDVAFKYYADNKLIYQSFGDGIESAMVNIYGAKIIGDCFCINADKNGLQINGYIGKHYFTKGNRSYQTIFLNGRYINNQTVSSSISNAYAPYLMKRQYPFYVLNITMPSEMVDCNVHPNKIDVRFQNNQIVYGSIYSVVSKVLDGSEKALDIVENNEINSSDFNIKYDTHNNDVRQSTSFVNPTVVGQNLRYDKLVFSDSGKSCVEDIFPLSNENKSDNTVDIFAQNKAYLEELEKKRTQQQENTQQEIKIERQLKYIGQALNTYLIFEDGEDIYLVDQHAAHERILFDKFNKSLSENEIPTQPLLIPYLLNVNPTEFDFLSQKIDILKQMGIEIEDFGLNSVKISSIPLALSDLKIKDFFDDILSDIIGLKAISITELLKEKIAQKACKSAIKSGDKLSDYDITALITMLNGNLGVKCPHGRPIAVKITRTEIDKWFKRIV